MKLDLDLDIHKQTAMGELLDLVESETRQGIIAMLKERISILKQDSGTGGIISHLQSVLMVISIADAFGEDRAKEYNDYAIGKTERFATSAFPS